MRADRSAEHDHRGHRTSLKNELLREVAETILANDKMTPEAWTRIVVSRQYKPGNTSMSGLVYTTDGKYASRAPTAPSPDELLDQLRTTMTDEDAHRRSWVAVLILLDRRGDDVSMEFDFDYDDAHHWEITFDNIAKIAAEFRPKAKRK